MKNSRRIMARLGVVALVFLIASCERRANPPREMKAEIGAPGPIPSTAAAISPERHPQDDIRESRETAITRAVRRVSDAVVGINVTSIRQYRRSIFEDDPFFRRFFPAEPYRQEVKSLGSGFVIDTEGRVVTNEHVVSGAVEITVTLTDGTHHLADIIGTDPISDIALLKIRDPKNLQPVVLGNSDNLLIGEWVIALGNPFGLFDLNAKPSVTVGVISALNLDFGRLNQRVYKDIIQTDASINQGNSGGPLVNALGEVIGVNAFIFTGEDGGGSIGLGFAIPINQVKKIIAELQATGKVKREFTLGMEVEDMSLLVARFLGLRSTSGVILTEVQPGGPADRAGLRTGDVLLALSGQRIRNTRDYLQILVDIGAKKGSVLKATIYRDGQVAEVPIRI